LAIITDFSLINSGKVGIIYSSEHGRNKKSMKKFKLKTQGKRQLRRSEYTRRCKIALKWILEKEVLKM
jgi:hypothetical protein